MNYGLYLSASGVLTSMYRQDVLANNLANAQTVGYRRDLPSVSQRAPEAAEDAAGASFRHALLDKLGGGVWAGPQRLSTEPGPVTPTGRDLDVALDAPDSFLAVQVRDPQTGKQAIRLTRDGRFTVSRDGKLVLAAGGQTVLDTEDRPIAVNPAAPVRLSPSGEVTQHGQVLARLQVTGVSDPGRLVKEGQNLLRFDGAQRRPVSATGVQPGHLEGSDVDPIRTLLALVDATKQATANGNMIRYHDLTMDRAVNVLGRVG